ncbi:hypothetical protein GCM10009827_083950 [Dactylosporangium maewongense]|uniref:Uncharacterized protein n=1 Tax=Dactylosporangium maewongense TaxID=634393 RepID=A0ABN2C3C9_9ACTN
MTNASKAPCPPYCDATPDGGMFCGGGDKHVPGWPVGLPAEGDPIVAEDGTVVTVAITDVGGGELRLSLILRQYGREVHLPLSGLAALDLQEGLDLGRDRLSRFAEGSVTRMSADELRAAYDWRASRVPVGATA